MRSKLLLLAATAVLLPFGVGCSSSRVVRGQGPGDPSVYQAQANAAYDAEYEYDDCDCEECSRRDLRRARREERRANRPHHQCQPYHVPHDLSYPPHGDMPGIVQYPYYTNKGPDCFFYDSDGKR